MKPETIAGKWWTLTCYWHLKEHKGKLINWLVYHFYTSSPLHHPITYRDHKERIYIYCITCESSPITLWLHLVSHATHFYYTQTESSEETSAAEVNKTQCLNAVLRTTDGTLGSVMFPKLVRQDTFLVSGHGITGMKAEQRPSMKTNRRFFWDKTQYRFLHVYCVCVW